MREAPDGGFFGLLGKTIGGQPLHILSLLTPPVGAVQLLTHEEHPLHPSASPRHCPVARSTDFVEFQSPLVERCALAEALTVIHRSEHSEMRYHDDH